MSGIQVKYAELFRLSIEQLFYANKICRNYVTTPEPDILLVPTDTCQLAMKHLDIVFKNTPTNGGCVILARVTGKNAAGNEVLRFKPNATETLSFLMMGVNPEIVSFNNLPAQPATDQLYYFNNSVADAAAARNDLHLSLNAAGVDGLTDIIKVAGANYRFHHTAVVLAGTAKIVNVATGETQVPVSIINQGGQSDLSFNLSVFTAGRYQLKINNVITDEFFYPGALSTGFIFGIVEISLSPTIIPNYRVVEADNSITPVRPLYSIEMLNRNTFWRYKINLNTNSPLYLEMAALSAADKAIFLAELNIESNDSSITFTQTNASDTAFEFVSVNAIGLHEKYYSTNVPAPGFPKPTPLSLTLRKYIGEPKKADVKVNLPFPAPGNINPSNPAKIYSDIFLTI